MLEVENSASSTYILNKENLVMKEIERRFLVENLKEINLKNYNKKRIEQVYLYTDIFTAIRKRKMIQDNIEQYWYTVKTKTSSQKEIGIEELEQEISKEEYNALEVPKNSTIIDKERFYIPIEDNLCMELDVFHGEFEGLAFVEIEFPSEDKAREYCVPDWFGKELTGKITNSCMSKMKFLDVKHLLDTI